VLNDRDGTNDQGGNGPAILRAGGDRWPNRVGLPWYDHWPVTQVPVLARAAQAADRPAHTWTSTQYSAPCETTSNSMTKIMLCGLTDQPIEALLPLARSWLRPAKLTMDSQAFAGGGYDPTERAYVLTCHEPGKPAELTLRIDGSAESPIVNPAFVIRNWGDRGVQLAVNGESATRGKGFRYGHRRHLDGTDLVLWLKAESVSTVRVTVAPAG
jgi:hypothetical protein